MAGHSKWANIKRKKEKTDAQKAKAFTKVTRRLSLPQSRGRRPGTQFPPAAGDPKGERGQYAE